MLITMLAASRRSLIFVTTGDMNVIVFSSRVKDAKECPQTVGSHCLGRENPDEITPR